jgi:anaerobic magnesium-protoporphyrin IX monomethyl ester cyclase
VITLGLDAIIIADSGEDSFSVTHPLRLTLDGKDAFIQVVSNYLEHQGHVVPPIEGDERMSWASAPKLNGIYLQSYLTKHNFKVELIDRFHDEKDSFMNLLRQTPRAVIISTTFIHSKQALYRLADDIRSVAPDIFIVAGGPFIYLSYLMFTRAHEESYETESAKDDFLFLKVSNEPSVDLYIISLRGERILCDALRRIKDNKSIDTLPNSVRLSGQSYSFGEQIDDVTNADEIVVDWNSVPDRVFESGVIPIQASNGCPYNCAFCNFTKDRRLMFVKPIDKLVAELKAVSQRGIRYVWFTDDNFRLGKGNLESVCQRLADESLPIQWMSLARASTLRNVDGELLRQAGCIEVQLGLESGDPQILDNMNKKASPGLYREVVGGLLGAGVNCSCYFIFGFPGETDETASRTLEFIKSIEHPELEGILTWSMFPFVLIPLSPIYELEMRKKYGLTGYMLNWKHKTMDSSQPGEHIKRIFVELEDSGPISRGDNLDLFFGLTPEQRRNFVALRHKLSKLGMKSQLNRRETAESFANLLLKRENMRVENRQIRQQKEHENHRIPVT